MIDNEKSINNISNDINVKNLAALKSMQQKTDTGSYKSQTWPKCTSNTIQMKTNNLIYNLGITEKQIWQTWTDDN